MGKTTEQIQNHLEFLGYKVEKTAPKKEGEKEVFNASSPSRYNFSFFEFRPSCILFRLGLNTEKKQSHEMDFAVNKANAMMNFTKVYYEINKDDGLAIIRYEIIYIGEYSKELFGQFFTEFEKDQNISSGFEDFNKAFNN